MKYKSLLLISIKQVGRVFQSLIVLGTGMQIRPQGIMLQILLIMLFQISLKIPHYAHCYSFYAPRCHYYSIVPIAIANDIQCTSKIRIRVNKG